MVVGAVFALDLKPTGGAQSDLFLWHLKSIEQYRTLPFFEAMVRQQSAMGPFNYAIFSQFNLGAPELRLIACGFLILSAFIFAATASPFLEAQNVRLPGQITVSPFVFCYVLFTALITLNPFILGPTVWANPDGLSVLMLALSGLAAVRVRNAIGAALLAGLFFALACLTRQILFPLSLLLLLILLRSHSPLTRAETIRLAAILLAPATAGPGRRSDRCDRPAIHSVPHLRPDGWCRAADHPP